MRVPFRTLDVFTGAQFSGNPLAVVLEAGALSTFQMQAIAREFNYSETAFVRPAQDPKHTAEVRIFTPTIEVPFAGHPNVGAAFLLASLSEHADKDDFVFEERAGLVPIRVMRKGPKVVQTQLTAPQRLSTATQYDARAVANCLGLSVADISTNVHAPLIASVGLPFLVAEITTRNALLRAKPQADVFAQHLPRDGADINYSARMFAPSDGLPEDPATGSATAAAMALVSRVTAKANEVRRIRVAQGVDMGRPCLLEVEIATAHDVQQTVRVGGACMEVMEGFVKV